MRQTAPLNIVALFYWEALDFGVYIKELPYGHKYGYIQLSEKTI